MAAPVLAILFADGFSGAYTIAKPIMDTYGFAGVEMMPTDSESTRCHLTAAQLVALDAAGWDVCSHGIGGVKDYTALPPADILTYLTRSYNSLIGWGIGTGAKYFGPPGHYWDVLYTPIATAAGFTYVVEPGSNGGNLLGAWEPDFQAAGLDIPMTTLSNWVETLADDTIGIFTMHNVRDPAVKSNDADPGRITDICDLCVSSGLSVVVLNDVSP